MMVDELENNIIREFTQDFLDEHNINEFYVQTGKYLHVFVGSSDEIDVDMIIDKLNAILPDEFFIAKETLDTTLDNDGDEQYMLFIDVFPLYGNTVNVTGDLYHVTHRDNLSRIQEHGFIPSVGGNDFITIANPRIYFCTDAETAEAIHLDMLEQRPNISDDYVVITVKNDGRTFYEDVEASGGVWTDKKYRPENILEITDAYDFSSNLDSSYGLGR